MKRSISAAIALLGMVSFPNPGMAQIAAGACIPEDQAQALVTVVLPDMLTTAQRICMPGLPRNAYLSNLNAGYMNRLRAAQNAALPKARTALGTLAGPQGAALAQSGFALPMIQTLMSGLVTKELQPEDCPAASKILRNLEPLPPANLASVIVTAIEVGARKHKDEAAFQICPTNTGE